MIVDIDFDRFLASVPLFLDQVTQVDRLNLFINGLNEADRGPELEYMRPLEPETIIKREHAEFLIRLAGEKEDATPKINCVCDAIREQLVKRNENNRYLLPILTTYVKK